jgi:HAD superfamily hydrolase (TIGR01509 family)
MEKLNLKAVIFDWSGTLSDDVIPCYNASISIRRHYNTPGSDVPIDEWKKLTRSSAFEFLQEHGVTDSEEKILDIFSKYYAQSPIGPKPFDDVEDALSALKSKGLVIGVISSHPHEHVMTEMKSYGFDKYISFAFGSIKDKAKALKELAIKLGIDASEILYLGDMTWDIRAAKGAGVRSAAILRGYHGQKLIEEKPDVVIGDMSELKKFIA